MGNFGSIFMGGLNGRNDETNNRRRNTGQSWPQRDIKLLGLVCPRTGEQTIISLNVRGGTIWEMLQDYKKSDSFDTQIYAEVSVCYTIF